MIASRQPPSGPIASPVPSVGIDGWTLGAPLTLTLQRAGHRPGVYTVGVEFFVRVAAGAGNLNTSTLGWNLIGLGPVTSVFAPAAPTLLGARLNAYRSIVSSGLAPITYTLVPTSITGSPIADVSAYAELVNLAVS